MGRLDGDKIWTRDWDAVTQLAQDGKGRNQIAKETGLSAYRVTKIAKDAGITFDRANLAKAVAVLAVDTRARRAEIAQRVLAEIATVFEKMHSEHVIVGWYEGIAYEHVLKRPTSGDYKNYATVLGILIDKHLVLERFAQEDGNPDSTLVQVQLATEIARRIKSHPDLSVDEIVTEITRR